MRINTGLYHAPTFSILNASVIEIVQNYSGVIYESQLIKSFILAQFTSFTFIHQIFYINNTIHVYQKIVQQIYKCHF